MRPRSSQKGAALFFALMFILILSVLGVSIMFMSQAETWSSLNYLEMTQARYGAEAGLNSASNYIVNTYCAPGNTSCSNGSSPASGDTISLYNTNVSPVTLVSNGEPVKLSTTSSASNYPVSSVESAFQSAAAGSVTSGSHTVNYSATATLVAMNQVTTAAGTQTVQTWNITGNGTITSGRSASEQVNGIVEQQVVFGAASAPSYGVFATGTGCDAISVSNGISIASYNSAAALSGGSVVIDSYGGNIGTNGNLTATGGATVKGTFSTPRTGVSTSGSCSSSAPNALDYNNGAVITECGTSAPVSPATTCSSSPVLLSQNVSYATPTIPTAPSSWNSTALTVTSTTTCSSLGLSSGCSGSAGNLTISSSAQPSNGFGPLTVDNGGKLTLTGSGTLTVNSITISGGGSFTITPSAALTINTESINLSNGDVTTLNNTSAMTLNVYGAAGVSLQGGTALTLSGTSVVTMNIASTVTTPLNAANGSWSNVNSAGAPVPAHFLINYAGTSTISLEGGSQTAAAIYAPNAPISLGNGSNWYGSLIGSTITDTGGVNIYYDQALGSTGSGTAIATVQQFMMDSFSWARF